MIPRRIDALIAAGAFVALGVPVLIGGVPQMPGLSFGLASQQNAPLTAAAACIAMPLALAFRKTLPAISTAVIYLLALTHFLAGVHLLPVDVLVLLSLYSVVMHGSLLSQVLGIVGAYIGAAIIAVWSVTFAFSSPKPIFGLYAFLGAGGAVTLTWAVALSRRTRQRELAALAEVNQTLQAERQQEMALAATTERTRIAREMHDIVAHSLSVMIAQADGGRYAATQNPTAAISALATIGDIGRDALADMRKILGVLREETDASPTRPQASTTDLANLVAQVRESGLDIALLQLGQPRSLPPGVDTALYRVCQEALTNVLKHGGPNVHVTVMVRWQEGAVELKVDDDGRGAAAQSDDRGHGLVGMRERATVFGGTLVAGPRAGGGFRVHLTLPLPRISNSYTDGKEA